MIHEESQRRIILIPHTGRRENVISAINAACQLTRAGIEVKIIRESINVSPKIISKFAPFLCDREKIEGKPIELVLSLGGDGTFLRAADLARSADAPVLGINLGHVGFLSEWESDSLEEAINRVIAKNYRVVNRLTVDISVFNASHRLVKKSWALNEVAIRDIYSSGVLDVILEVDGRPVSTFGCDGVLISTPTGSTAYAFSAGGPILWPELDAILVVPNNGHALFTKPLVVSPKSTIAVELMERDDHAQALMDGLRSIDIPCHSGARCEIRRGAQDVRWVRLDDQPFADRLVHKFRLPVAGWRGPDSLSAKAD